MAADALYTASMADDAMYTASMVDDATYKAAMDGDSIAKTVMGVISGIMQSSGSTLLHVESAHGNKERVQFLTSDQYFANENFLFKTNPRGETALHLAIEGGHADVVDILMDAARNLAILKYDDFMRAFTAFVRQANKWNNTALHRAVAYGNLGIVEVLAKADPRDRHIKNHAGETPLHLAARLGHNDIVKMIGKVCAAPSINGPAGVTALHAAILRLPKAWKKNSLDANKVDRDAFMELIKAAKRSAGSKDSLEAILDKTTPEKKTILDLAVRENYTDVVELILAEHPAYKPGREITAKSDLSNLIDIASQKGYNDMVKLLCKTYEVGRSSGDGQAVITYKGLHAFIVAIKSRDQDFVIYLLEENESLVTCSDKDGWKPLHHAVFHEFDSILELIVSTHIRNGYGIAENDRMTALGIAIERGHTSTLIQLMQLLPSDQSYLIRNPNGENILHLAASQRKKEIIQSILKHCPVLHADTMLNQQDNDGDTPLHILIAVGCFVPEVIKHKSCQTVVKNWVSWTQTDMLYKSDDIIFDQVRIKEALDDIQESNQCWKFWGGRNLETPYSRVTKERRSKKDAKFKETKKEMITQERTEMKKEVERYRLRTNTQIIVTTLITTVTFTVGFTMPGGYHQSGEPDEGLVLLSKKKAFRIFMVSDALALALSLTSLFIYFISSMYEDSAQVSRFNIASTVLNIISVVAMMLTFIAGAYVVLSHSLGLTVAICIICSLFFLAVIILLVKLAYDRTKVKKLRKLKV